VGQGIFKNQPKPKWIDRFGKKKMKEAASPERWTSMVSRSLLFRVRQQHSGDFSSIPISGTAICVSDIENGIEKPKLAGFQSFVQVVGLAQHYDLEGERLWRRLNDGDISFCGAFQLLEKLTQKHIIV
jgi:hypothetical protein